MDVIRIDVDPFHDTQIPRGVDSSSNALRQLANATKTFLYRGYMSMWGWAYMLFGWREETPDEQLQDKDNVKITKITDFNARAPDDDIDSYISGILAIGNKIIICDNDNYKLKVFDCNGSFMSSINSKHSVWGITKVNIEKFATCSALDTTIHIWTLRNETVACDDVSFTLERYCDAIYFNSTFYSVLHRNCDVISVLDTRGTQVREFVINFRKKFRKSMKVGFDIYMDSSTHHIYVPCVGKNTNHKVLCLSITGHVLWLCCVPGKPMGITSYDNCLCLAANRNVYFISKTGHREEEMMLLRREYLRDWPKWVCYDGQEKKLFITFFGLDKVSVYSI